MNFSLARLGKVDVRKDEEQNIKLTEILKLLFQVGYFRARIKGIPPFDKIVGGITWCIEVCAFDIDVDLLFHDSLAIGQKIALTERIVQVLKLMKCPHQLEPHQIQGLDSIHIHPVIVWLVNLAANTRTEYEDETRAISVAEFKRQYSDYLNMASRLDDFERTETIRQIKVKYSEKSDILNTKVKQNDDPKIYKRPASPAVSVERENVEHVTDKLSKEVMKTMEKLDLKRSNLNDLIMREDKLSKIDADLSFNYERLLEEKENSGFTNVFEDRQLVEVVELFKEDKTIRSNIATFKKNCHLKFEQITDQIQYLKEKLEAPCEKVDPSLIQNHSKEMEKLNVLENELACRSNEVERLKIRIDDTPGTAELAQYQKRLIELYSQVQAVHQETQQFYNLYNTLADSKFYMEKEFILMDSINSNVENVSGEVLRRSQFCSQLITARDGIEDNTNKLDEKLRAAQLNRDAVANELNRLQEVKLRYGRMLRAVDKAVLENEQLQKLY